MDENNSIQLFEDRKIRTAWDEEQEEWYFSVVDVIAVLTDSSNPTDYLKKMRKRDEQLASYLGTNCPQVAQPVKEPLLSNNESRGFLTIRGKINEYKPGNGVFPTPICQLF